MLGHWHRYDWQELWEASCDLSPNGSARSYWFRFAGMLSTGPAVLDSHGNDTSGDDWTDELAKQGLYNERVDGVNDA